MKRRFLITAALIICIIVFSYTTVLAVEEGEDVSPPATVEETTEPSASDKVTSDLAGEVIEDKIVSDVSGVKEVSDVKEEEDLIVEKDEKIESDEPKEEPKVEKSDVIVLTAPTTGEEVVEETPTRGGAKGPSSEEETTPTIGARSATDEYGNVFLGGNYLEVGISSGGSFGTSAPAPAEFGSHATYDNYYQLGLLMDGDGWDVGNAPTTGDFFLPGTPEERYGIAYKIDGVTHQYFKCDRYDEDWYGYSNATSPDFTASTVDASDLTNGILKAIVTATTPHGVVVENTYSFGVDDKYYRTEVKIINNSDKEITDVRFFRSFDPDQDHDIYDGVYSTYNKVICNPDSSIPGDENNFAMVVARGAVSLEGFFLVSFDNRARASWGVSFAPESLYMSGLWNETTEGLPTYSTDESLQMTTEDTNGYTNKDTGIALTFNLGSIAAGESTELSHFSSLDPDVISSLSKIKEAIAATVDNVQDTSLTIITTEGYEYSIDGGETWQTEGTFEGLDPDTEYVIISRPIGGGETSEVVASTKKSGPQTPDIKEKIVTENSITVESNNNYEYSIDGGETWQDDPEFTGLEANTEYSIVARLKETDDTMPGKFSNPLTVTTLAPSDVDIDAMEVVLVTVELNGSIDSVKINKGSLFSAIGDDPDLEVALNEGQNIEIKFVINDSNLTSEELNLVNSQLKNGEAIALTVDISIELYIDNEYVKNITELEEPISFTLTLPESILKGNKNFAVVCTHETSSGEYIVTRLSDDDNDKATVTIAGKNFSNYTIVSEKENTAVGSAAESSSVAGTKVLHLSPKTGDNIILYIALCVISFINIATISIYTKKRLIAF